MQKSALLLLAGENRWGTALSGSARTHTGSGGGGSTEDYHSPVAQTFQCVSHANERTHMDCCFAACRKLRKAGAGDMQAHTGCSKLTHGYQ